jgi:hypothetical protein
MFLYIIQAFWNWKSQPKGISRFLVRYHAERVMLTFTNKSALHRDSSERAATDKQAAPLHAPLLDVGRRDRRGWHNDNAGRVRSPVNKVVLVVLPVEPVRRAVVAVKHCVPMR